ncbi:hypothetical protein [Leptothoe spongobia]|uniref:Uncharacterized protein n=1 Tax=Leptothoe spongobia TAU-MAC 1115 TaxID=1967444 RepID=A0A947DG77_9CYAN|nr:hypothetical protein [Leptothoe spongobia]MBT9315993.1 hypothetical protein [Leptothoe spongobia TAU-MAC 1115]
MLDKLLGKKSRYYLELSEDEIAAVPKPADTPTPKSAAPKAAPVADAKPAAPKATPVAAAKPATPKAASDKASEKAVTPAVATNPIPDSQELIRTALAASVTSSQPLAEKGPEPTFSSDYLMPKASAGRRRPGPSMSPFKSMAKNMRRQSSGF